MDIFIGSLIVLSLFSVHTAKIDFMYYELYKSQNSIIRTIKNLKRENYSEEDIDEMLEKIEKKSKVIKSLLKEKNMLRSKVNTTMNVFAFSKKTMTEEQMTGFREYTEFLSEKDNELKLALEKIRDKESFKSLTTEIMITNSDLNKIYSELEEISKHQENAINSLNSIIDNSKLTLEIL